MKMRRTIIQHTLEQAARAFAEIFAPCRNDLAAHRRRLTQPQVADGQKLSAVVVTPGFVEQKIGDREYLEPREQPGAFVPNAPDGCHRSSERIGLRFRQRRHGRTIRIAAEGFNAKGGAFGVVRGVPTPQCA